MVSIDDISSDELELVSFRPRQIRSLNKYIYTALYSRYRAQTEFRTKVVSFLFRFLCKMSIFLFIKKLTYLVGIHINAPVIVGRVGRVQNFQQCTHGTHDSDDRTHVDHVV